MYTKVGNSEIPTELLKTLTLDELKTRFKTIPGNVLEIEYKKLNPKKRRKPKKETEE